MESNKEKNITYLKTNYSKKSKKEIMETLNLSWPYIQKLAHYNNIKREFNENVNDWKYKKLLDYYNNITLYWIGFMLADGHISKQKNIQINLSKNDKDHIIKLQQYLGGFKIIETPSIVRITLSDKKTISKLSNDFGWESNKTKIPIQIPKFLTDDGIFSLIIGFIDGDGSICNKGMLRIKCDSSWKEILEFFYYHLTNENKKFNLTSDNCSLVYINKLKTLKNIKEKILNLELPVLDRKWNKVQTRLLKNEKHNIVKNLVEKGYNFELIKKETSFSNSFIHKVIKQESKK
jgi:hypothetical protein